MLDVPHHIHSEENYFADSFQMENNSIVATVFPFDYELNGIPLGSYTNEKLSPRSYSFISILKELNKDCFSWVYSTVYTVRLRETIFI